MTNGPPDLLVLQNADGGWSYHRGSSWLEPTCFAVLALVASGMEKSSAAQRASAWLTSCRRPDGGFAPRQSVDKSTWITALPLLLPSPLINETTKAAAIQWLIAQSGRESDWIFRLRLFLLGESAGTDI